MITYRVVYRFNLGSTKSQWYFLMETKNILEAKQGVQRMKKYFGQNGGNVKIIKIES